MDGCLFAMEIVGNYINGPLFKQWASEMQKTDLNLKKQVRLLWKFWCWCFPLCNWILFCSLLLQGAEEASSWAQGCQQTKCGVFEKRGKLLLSAGQGEGGGHEAHRHSSLHLLHGFKVLETHFADVNIFSWGTWHILGWTTSTSEGSSHGLMRTAWSLGTTISGGDVLHVFDEHSMCFPRSYTAIGDVIALFVILPLLVRSLQLHDLSIVIIAVLSQVRNLNTLISPQF